MSPYIVVFCIQYDFIQMCAKKPKIQNGLPIISKVKLTSYLFNKLVANKIELCLCVNVLTTIFIQNKNFTLF